MAFTAPVARVKKRGEPTSLKYAPDPVVDPLNMPTCPPGSRPGGALRTCAKACDAQAACDKGHCEPWPMGDFCAMP